MTDPSLTQTSEATNWGISRRSKGLVIFALLALLVLPFGGPTFAGHGTRTLEVHMEVASNPIGTTHDLTATLSPIPPDPPPAAGINIDFEITSGPAVTLVTGLGSGTGNDGNTLNTPDMTCTISFPDSSCTVSFSSALVGTNLVRAWIDHDDSDATPEADTAEGRISDPTTDCTDPSDPLDCADAPTPGNTPEPDITDVVQKSWTAGAASKVDCNPETSTNSTDGPNRSTVYTCTITDNDGNAITTSQRLDAENLSGINDPDGGDVGDADYPNICTTSNGTCTATVPPLSGGSAHEGQAGTALICFWLDDDNDNLFGPSLPDNDGGDCDNEALTESPENNDKTDIVQQTWEFNAASGLDVQPETGTNNLGGPGHVLVATVYDQTGTPFNAFTDVKFEFFSGSPNDGTDGNTPGSPDRTCSTGGGSTCTVTVNSPPGNQSGTDLICAWTDTAAPAMTGTNVNGTCDDADSGVPAEGRADSTSDNGVPNPSNDSVDVVSKTWNPDPYQHLHIVFSPPTANSHDCNNGPLSDQTPVGVTNQIVACAHDQFANPIPNVTVTPTVALGPGTVSPSSGLTGSNGRVTFNTNSNEVGNSFYGAFGPGGTVANGGSTISNEWVAGDFEHLHLAFSPPTTSGDECSAGPNITTGAPNGSGIDFTACAHDEFNNPKQGVVVTATVQSGPGSISPASATTDNRGRALFEVSSTATGNTVISAVGEGSIIPADNTISVSWGCDVSLRTGGWMAYSSSFRGGVFIAVGDVDGDGCEEVIVGPDSGLSDVVRIYDGSGTLLKSFFAYGGSFTKGVRVAAADVDGDGNDEVITGPGPGGGPHVKVFDADAGVSEKFGFMAYASSFRGGVFVGGGDVLSGGFDEVITAPDETGGPHVRVFRGSGASRGTVGTEYMAYSTSFRGGVRVAAGQFDGDAREEVVTAPGPGGGPHVIVWNVGPLSKVFEFFSYASSFRGGVYVAATDLYSGCARDELITGADAGGGPHVRAFTGTTVLNSFFAYASGFKGGVRVAGGETTGLPPGEIWTAPGSGGGPHVKPFSPTPPC